MSGNSAAGIAGDGIERAGGPRERMRHNGSSKPASPTDVDYMQPPRQPSARSRRSSQTSASTARLQVLIRSSPAPGAPPQIPPRSTTTEGQRTLFSSKGLPTRPAQSTALPAHRVRFEATPMGDAGDSNSASQPRKRGRPKGWKAGMSYAELRGDPPPTRIRKSARPARPYSTVAAPTDGGPRRRGRPSKPPPPTPREQYLKSEPRYVSFGCEWHAKHPSGEAVRCPAELQNMHTLRQHVFLIHGDSDPLVCRWGKCGNVSLPNNEGPGSEQQGQETRMPQQQQREVVFPDEQAFRKHVERAHFRSYVWHMGDGIQNRGIWTLKEDANKLPPYLFDKDGNMVTPSVRGQLHEDTKGMLERKRKLREIQRLAQENAPEESEFELRPLA